VAASCANAVDDIRAAARAVPARVKRFISSPPSMRVAPATAFRRIVLMQPRPSDSSPFVGSPIRKDAPHLPLFVHPVVCAHLVRIWLHHRLRNLAQSMEQSCHCPDLLSSSLWRIRTEGTGCAGSSRTPRGG